MSFQQVSPEQVIIHFISLQKVHISESVKEKTEEDVEHLFFHCPFSSSFWTDFEAFWSSNMNETINLSLQDIIVGINNEKSKFLNYCILVGKSTIFHSRTINKKLHQKYSTELFIAQKCNKLNKFKEKWMFKPLI